MRNSSMARFGFLGILLAAALWPALADAARQGDCLRGWVQDGRRCYRACPRGMVGSGDKCKQPCPRGFADHGLFCAKPKPYGRGAGYPWKFGDAPFSLTGAWARCKSANRQGCEQSGLLVYPKCKKGFHAVGCCICSPNCPSGMKDIGVSCSRKIQGRGASRKLKSVEDREAKLARDKKARAAREAKQRQDAARKAAQAKQGREESCRKGDKKACAELTKGQLRDFLEKYKYCVWPGGEPGKPQACLKNPQQERNYRQLSRLASAGDRSGFQRLWEKSAGRNCYGPCKEHRKIHTYAGHCTAWAGGNHLNCGGLGPAMGYTACMGGMHVFRSFFEKGWNNLIGKPFRVGAPSVDHESLTGKGKLELHELRVGTGKGIATTKEEYTEKIHHKQLGDGDKGNNTFINWLALHVIREGTNPAHHGGKNVTDRRQHIRNILQNVVDGKFVPGESNPEKGIDDEGMRYLNSLPLTPWQRCYLWHPGGDGNCDPQKTQKSMKDLRKANWSNSPLFKEVLKHPTVSSYLDGYREFWKLECSTKTEVQNSIWFVPIPFTKRQAPKHNCKQISQETAKAANEQYRKGTNANSSQELKDSGDAIASAIGPIVGKILGMLLKAAGMYQMMKTLARAAGLTPEQSADCEDSEYRHEVMKLKKCSDAEIKNATCQDTKRGCLLKVFAKNFGTVLESIIVMLGNKLVDWGVDLLRNVLQVVKSAILTALASVPFGGGVLATIFDIGWELLMNFGAKMLLKGFVVAKLPEWLKIHELARQAMDKLMEHPIVRTIAGIILQLIDAAMVHGEKSWMAVGVDSAINGIQLILQNVKPTPYFWIRALQYAKREMARNATSEGSILDQLRKLAQAMIGGFGAAIGRGIKDETVRASFETAVDDIKGLLAPGKASDLLSSFQRGPIAFLTDLIAKKIGPVVMPILTTFVPMDQWVKGMLLRLGAGIATTVDELKNGRINGKTLVARIVEVFEPQGKRCEERVFCRLLRQLPAGPALKNLLEKGFTKLTDLLRDIDQIPAYLSKPWDVVAGLVDLVGGFLKEKVGDLFAGIGIEKKLVTGALDTLLSILTDANARARLFGARPDPAALLAKLAEAVKPYAVERLKDLARGTGLESMVGAAVDVFFGPQGPLVRGEAFFRDLPALLRQHGPAVAAQALDAVSGIVQAQAARAGGPVLGSLAKGILGTLAQAMKAPGGLASLFRGGAADVLKLVKGALGPLVDALAPAKGKGSVVEGLLGSVLRGVLDLVGNPGSLRQLAQSGAGALRSLATQVAGALKGAMKSLVGQLVPDAALKALAQSGVDGFFELLSDPAKMAAASGAKVLDLLKAAGEKIFAFVKTKLAAVAGSIGGGAGAKAVVMAIAGQVEQVIANPSKLKSLVEGNAKALLSGIAEMLGQAAVGLVESAVPGALKPILKQVTTEVVGFLSNPTKLGQLGSMNAGALLQRVAPIAKSLLEGVLRSAVPAATWTALQAAIAKVQAALQNPAGLAAQAGAAAKQAIDQVIAAALFQIQDLGLRELASNLVAFVRDLVAGDAKATQLRGDPKAILGRLVTTGGRYLATLVPPGPVQEILTRAIDGLKGVLTGSGGPARSLAQKAAALLPGIKDALAGFLQTLLQRAIPDSRISLLVGGLVREVVTLVTEPKAWNDLKKQGATGLLARLVPAVRGFVLSMVGSLSGSLAELRPIAEGLFDALKDAKAISSFSGGSVSALVSLGISSIAPVVLRLVERATGSPGIAAFLRTALAKLSGFLSRPAELAAFLKKSASQAFGALLGEAQKLAEGLVDSVVHDTALKTLAKEGLKGVLEFVQRAAGGGDAASAAKAILVKLIPAVTGLLKGKLLEVLPARMGALKTLVTKGFDKLTSLATGIVTEGKAAFQRLLSGGGKLVGDLVGEVVSLLKPPLQRAIPHKGLASLVTGLLDALPRILANPGALRGQAGVKIVLGEVGTVLDGFLQRTIVSRLPAGMAQDVVGTVIREGVGLLKDPQRLGRFIEKAKTGKGLIQEIIGGIAAKLKGAIKGGLGDIVEKGLKVLVETVTARR